MTLLLLLLACPSTPDDSASACFDEAGGYGDATEDDLAAMETECLADGGSDCSPGGFIELDAATCLAAEGGLAESYDGSAWDAHLVYNYADRTVIWAVSNLEYVDGDTTGGSSLHVHATTGEILGEYDWEAMP